MYLGQTLLLAREAEGESQRKVLVFQLVLLDKVRQAVSNVVEQLVPGPGHDVPWQAWSLSSFKVSRLLLTNDLNQVSPVSLLMTAIKGLFELTLRP